VEIPVSRRRKNVRHRDGRFCGAQALRSAVGASDIALATRREKIKDYWIRRVRSTLQGNSQRIWWSAGLRAAVGPARGGIREQAITSPSELLSAARNVSWKAIKTGALVLKRTCAQTVDQRHRFSMHPLMRKAGSVRCCGVSDGAAARRRNHDEMHAPSQKDRGTIKAATPHQLRCRIARSAAGTGRTVVTCPTHAAEPPSEPHREAAKTRAANILME